MKKVRHSYRKTHAKGIGWTWKYDWIRVHDKRVIQVVVPTELGPGYVTTVSVGFGKLGHYYKGRDGWGQKRRPPRPKNPEDWR